jgi:hypothetical protein
MAKKKLSKSQEWQGKIKAFKSLVKKHIKALTSSHSKVLKSIPSQARKLTLGELLDKYQGNFYHPDLSLSEKRRITLRGSQIFTGTDVTNPRCSIVLPLGQNTVLDFDPTNLEPQALSKAIVGQEAREAVVKQVQALQNQLSLLLAGMEEDI